MTAQPATSLGRASISLSPAHHRRIKLLNVLDGTSIAELADQAFDEFFANHPELAKRVAVLSDSK